MIRKIAQPTFKLESPESLPVPPLALMEYRELPDRHLAGGKADYAAMMKAVLSAGYDVNSAARLLDFGCANGRVTRWFAAPETREVWGCDIQADKIYWALENLGPPRRFFVNSPIPHLPFPDRYFDYISAMSIFTHLQDSHIAWLLELCRVLAPSGCLYITLHDRDTMDPSKTPRAKYLRDNYFKGLEAVTDDLGSVGFLAMNPYANGALAQVYMTHEYLERILPPSVDIAGVIPRAYFDLQTGYVIRAKQCRK